MKHHDTWHHDHNESLDQNQHSQNHNPLTDWASEVAHLAHDIVSGGPWQSDLHHLFHPSDPLAQPQTYEDGLQVTHGGLLDHHLSQFDPTLSHAGLVGHPEDGIQQWHQQLHGDTSTIVSQEFILDRMGIHLSEEQLRQEAQAHGWYTPGAGTPTDAMGNLLALHGVAIHHQYGATLDTLSTELQQGHHILVSVSREDLWQSAPETSLDPLQGVHIPGLTSNHTVEVLGIDHTNPRGSMVILNDPAHPNGRGLEVPATQFMQAWFGSGNYMVATGTLPITVDHSTPGGAGVQISHQNKFDWSTLNPNLKTPLDPNAITNHPVVDPASFSIFSNETGTPGTSYADETENNPL